MKDRDSILLENLYSLIVEDAQSTKNAVLNKLISSEVGNEIFKYKNKPENQEVIKNARDKFSPIIDEISKIITDNNPKDKNLNDLEKLVYFRLQPNTTTELIEKEYKDYLKHPSLTNKKLLQNSKSLLAWTEQIHHLNNQTEEKKDEPQIHKSKISDPNHDPNQVYEDENVIVYLADTGNPKTSIENCKKYGKGTNLCISSSNAAYYYNQYRLEGNPNKEEQSPLTTYFVWLKKQKRYILIDIHEDGEYEYNNVKDNHDELSLPKQILKKHPEVSGAFKNNVFKPKPIEGKEKEFYEKYYGKELSDFNNLTDKINFISSFAEDLTKQDWKSIEEHEIEPILNVAINDSDNYIPLDILNKYPSQKSKFFKLIAKDYQEEVEKILPLIKNGKIEKDLDLSDFDCFLIPEIFPFLNDIKQTSGDIYARSATSLSLPQLQTSGYIYASSATSLSLPQLQTSGYIDASSATSLSLPQLKQTSEYIDARSATSLSLPQLQKSGYIDARSAKGCTVIIPMNLFSKVKISENGKKITPEEAKEEGFLEIKQESFKNYFRRSICLLL